MPRRRRGTSAWIIAILLVVVALPVVIGLAIYGFVDPNDFKPRIAESVRAATGRDIALDGPIRIGFSATPTLQAERVRLSNPPGFSRPDMATLAKVEAKLALWPLLRGRVEIIRLTLTEPNLLLETDAKGQSNWRFAPKSQASQPTIPGKTEPSDGPPQPSAPRFAVGDVRIMNGKLTWRDVRGNQTREADIRRFTATSAGPLAPVSASADLLVEGHSVVLSAETGPMERLFSGEALASGWPLQIVARVEGARLAASGSIERPLEGRGYQLTLDATAPDLTLLSKAVGRDLPPFHDVSASAKISDATGAPVASDLLLRAGPSDLGALVPGLLLERLQLTGAALDQPIRADFNAALADTKLHGVASLALPARPDFTAGTKLPIEASLDSAGAVVSTKGNLVLPRSVELGLAARIPDLAAFQGLAGRKLPALHDLALEAVLTDRDGDLANGVTLRNLKVTGPQGEIGGELAVELKPRIAIQVQLTSPMLDLDVIRADLAPTSPLPAALPAPAAAPPAPAPAPAAKPAPNQPAPAAASPRRVFPDTAFDLTSLARFDADLRFALAQARLGGVIYRDIAGRVELAQGRLALDPFSGVSPGGRVEGRFSLDSRQPDSPISLALAAPGLALKPLLTAAGLPDDATGTIEVAADLSAAGRSPHAIAASLSGKLGLAMTDGEIDNRLLATLVDMLRVAKIPAEMFGATGSRTKLRCFATRLDAQRGVAAVSAFVLDTGRALVQGGGVLNLGDEVLGLRLRPLVRTGGGGVVLPVRVAGPMRQPNVALDSGGALEGVAGNLAGNIAGLSRNPLAALSQALAGERGGDSCGPALAAARAARPNLK
jgi:uncharacterized protein involved in outer membrane biogenesis